MNQTPTTVVDGLRISARDLGNDHGILYYSSPDTTTYRGYADLDENARRLAHALTMRGYGVGDTAVIGITEALGVADAAFGAMYAGMAFVPAPVAGYGAGAGLGHSVSRIATASEAAVLLVDEGVLARLGDTVADFGIPVLVLEDIIAEGDPDAWVEPPIDGDTMAYLLFTSGSTGDPKGVITTHRGVIETARATGALFGATGTRRWWAGRPCTTSWAWHRRPSIPAVQRRHRPSSARPSCSSADPSSGCSSSASTAAR